ncbi:response regulator transcription factor [Deinococcus cellulosilyticus]|uniref:DNA-binding response regulator n=1 Tax=Deinococcus cellulosilyticus (strain DSM 18568 / NBRC 106333 / KACC 11606 / 5516J-15) TaxID=1223518 RepID=A0A511N174_DEIC1|nr:response regulator transcription factor [Deinococcus cellulosilyticus]GEM46624.1 DNA-binding response regulator [Deinococcus cellulosilyticus NBRC 106333 = KACC 11606]
MPDLPKVLVIEDEKDTARFIELELQAEGYHTHIALDGLTGLAHFREHQPDLVILDLMLPVLGGLDVTRRIRKTSNTPILVLSAKDALQDKIDSLDAGANDHLSKPFSIEELLARVRAHLRRTNPTLNGELRIADLVIDLHGREVFRAGRRIELTSKEFELLEFLSRHPARVLSRYELEEQLWPGYVGGSNVVDVSIGCLRRKLEREGERRLIHTIRSVGYVLRDDR